MVNPLQRCGYTVDFVMGGNPTIGISSTNQKVNYNRFVVQADFGNKNKKTELVISPRLFGVHYYNIIDNARSDYQNLSNFHIYPEGALTVRYPILKFLLISGQFCVTVPLTHPKEYNYYYEFSSFNANIGLVLNMNLLKPNKLKR